MRKQNFLKNKQKQINCKYTLFSSRIPRYETTEGEERITKESGEWQEERTRKLNRQEPTKEIDSRRVKVDKRESVIERRVIENVRQAPRDEGIKEDKRQSAKERRVNENVDKKKERAETKTAREPENTGSSQKPATLQDNKYSSSDNSENSKSGVINCICLYHTFDPEMLKCSNCGNFSHKTCYNSNQRCNHQCIQCLRKKGEKCGNVEIDNHFYKESRSYKEKQSFVFNLNRKRVLKSILNQEFLTCQPGDNPSIEFLKIRFGYSTQYANRITLNLINEGFIKFFDGFSFNAGLIIEELGLHNDDNESVEALRREVEEQTFEIGHCYNELPESSKTESEKRETLKGEKNKSLDKGKGPGKGKSSKPTPPSKTELGKRSRNPSPTTQGNGKRTRDSSPITPSPRYSRNSDSTGFKKSRENSLDFTSCSSREGSIYRNGSSRTSNSGRSDRTSRSRDSEAEKIAEPGPSRSRKRSAHRRESTKDPNSERSSEMSLKSGRSDLDDLEERNSSMEVNFSQTTLSKIIRDREGKRFKNKFTWPSRFFNSESLKSNVDNTPMSVAELGKRSAKPVYGQIVDKGEVKTKSTDASTSHFHFILGMEGSLVQVWVFGSDEEVKAIEKKIHTEEYFLFWGDYKVRDKYTSKFKSNSEWAIYLPGNCNKFDIVKKSRVYLESEDSISEEREIFADRFKPAVKKGRKAKRMKEHSSAKKRTLDASQPKITDFGITRTSSTSSTDSLYLKNWKDYEANKASSRKDGADDQRESSVQI